MIVRNENHMMIELRLRDPFQRQARTREAITKALAESPWERGVRYWTVQREDYVPEGRREPTPHHKS